MAVLNASGKLKRRRKKTKEDKIRDSATLIQAVFRGHQARKILRKHLHKKALENAISHEEDHHEREEQPAQPEPHPVRHQLPHRLIRGLPDREGGREDEDELSLH